MTLLIRSSYEKLRRPGSGRYGREEEVPLSVYHMVEDLYTQLDALRTLEGATRATLYYLADKLADDAGSATDLPAVDDAPVLPPVTTPPSGSENPPFTQQKRAVYVFPADAPGAGDATDTARVNIAFPFRVIEFYLGMQMSAANTGGANWALNIGGEDVASGGATYQNGVVVRYGGELIADSTVDNLKLFSSSDVIATFTNMNPTGHMLYGQVVVWQYEPL